MAIVLAGCGSEPSSQVPVGCKVAPSEVVRALAAAPGEVRLGGRRVSECFAPGGEAGDVQALGLAIVPAAERLAPRARAHPRGPAAIQLGFLVGAVRRGAERGRVYAELERRVRLETTGVDTASRAYRSGLNAGLARG
ncbi:MAG: hypothetical protein ACJ760_15355 [Thermoleophilaceae bacterium]